MEIARYIKQAAEDLLNQGTIIELPVRLSGTEFYLASAEDDSILTHGVIKDANGVEYKIGTRK